MLEPESRQGRTAGRPRRRRRDRPRRRRRWTDRLSLVVALLGVAGVVAINWLLVSRTERLRTSIVSESEAVRALSDSVALTVTQQAINLQAFLLTGDSSHLADYVAARADGDAQVVRLGDSARQFGPVTERTFGTAVELRDAWLENHDELLREARPREQALAQVDEERTRVLDLLAVLADLGGVAQLGSIERRAAIVQIYRIGALLTALMALVAIVSIASAYLYRQRMYARSEEARSRARELEKALGERQAILAVVSHDLRNSLNVVSAAIALVHETELPAEVKTRQLKVARRTVGGMTRLISDLLDISTLDAGGLKIHAQPVDSRGLVAEAVEAWTPEATAKGLALAGRTAPDAGPVGADAERILQVLGNLIGNAIKFTPEGGTVRVSVAPAEGGARFTVEDTGPGIPGEHLPRIFDRFYQVRSSGRAGAGLGLSIARGIVEAHGSSLEVETWPGTGTRFWFDLAAAGAQPEAVGDPAHAIATSRGGPMPRTTASAARAEVGPTAGAG